MNTLKRWIHLVEPARILREGFLAILESETAHFATACGSGEEALGFLRRQTADVLVFNMDLPDQETLAFIQAAKASRPSVKLVGYDFNSVAHRAIEFIRRGCSGCLLGDFSEEDIRAAVRTADGQGLFLSAEAARLVIDFFIETAHRDEPTLPSYTLSRRERRVVQLIAEGRHTPEIARRLGISVNSASYHRRRLMAKLHLHSVSQLTKWAIQQGLATPLG